MRFWDPQGPVSDASTALPIWARGSFKHVRIALIIGGSELLLCMHTIKKLDIAVCFGIDRFHVGQGWGMLTFNEKHRWVFPLVPTSCAYAKLVEYFGKIAECGNYGHATSGDCVDHLEAGKASKIKNQRFMGKIQKRLFLT